MKARSRRALVCGLALGLAGASARADEPTPCRASGSFEPPEALVGQQVLYRIEIASAPAVDTVEWRRPPSFPGFRAERLPGRPGSAGSGSGSWRVREEHRALFPERPGELRAGSALLHCRVSDAGGRGFDVELQPSILRVLPHPHGEAGLVGPLSVRTRAEPSALELGGSVRLEVTLFGSGNLWDAPDPLSGLSLGSTEVFRRRPELRLEPGTQLLVRRTFHYDLVPRREGVLRIPALAASYLDPETRREAVARSEALEVRVAPRAARGGPARPAHGKPAAEEGWPLAAALGASLAGLAVGAGTLAAAVRLRRRSRRRIESESVLAAAAAARASGDAVGEAAALARALREALSHHALGAREKPVPELANDPSLPVPVSTAAELLAALDRSRFDPDADPPNRADVERAVRELSRRGGLSRRAG